MSDPTRFTVPSNSGRDTTVFELTERLGTELKLRIQLESEFWERTEAELGDQAPEHDVTLHQVVVAADSLRLLREALVAWLEASSPFELRMAASPGQELSLSVQPLDSQESSQGQHPRFCVKFSTAPGFLVEWSYVVDQSCLTITKNEVSWVMRNLER